MLVLEAETFGSGETQKALCAQYFRPLSYWGRPEKID